MCACVCVCAVELSVHVHVCCSSHYFYNNKGLHGWEGSFWRICWIVQKPLWLCTDMTDYTIGICPTEHPTPNWAGTSDHFLSHPKKMEDPQKGYSPLLGLVRVGTTAWLPMHVFIYLQHSGLGYSTINFPNKNKIVKSLRNMIHSRPTACTLTSVQCMQSQDSYLP